MPPNVNIKRFRIAPPRDLSALAPIAFSDAFVGIGPSPEEFIQGNNFQMYGNDAWYCADRLGVPMSRLAMIFDGWGPNGAASVGTQPQDAPVIEFLLAFGTGQARYEQMAFGKFDFADWKRTGLILQVSGLLFTSWSLWVREAAVQPPNRTTDRATFVIDFLADRVAGPCGADRSMIPLPDNYPNVDYVIGQAVTLFSLPQP